MLKGLELEFAHQLFWRAVQNVEIRGVCCIRVCIKLRAVCEQRGRAAACALLRSRYLANFCPLY